MKTRALWIRGKSNCTRVVQFDFWMPARNHAHSSASTKKPPTMPRVGRRLVEGLVLYWLND